MSRRFAGLLGDVLGVLAALALIAPAPLSAENAEQTLRVKTKTVQLAARPAKGQIDLQIGKTLYRFFIRDAEPAAATKAKVAEIQASSLIEIVSIPYGDYRKVTKLTLFSGDDADIATVEKSLPRPYNGCITHPKLSKRLAGRAAWNAAFAEARAWQSDARLNEMQTLRDSPLDAEGKSSSWVVHLYSDAAGAIDLITLTRGVMSCYASPSNRLPTLDVAGVIFDTQQVYNAAQKAGGSDYTAEGYTVGAGLIRGFQGVPSWYLSYDPPGGTAGSKTIIVNAETGTVQ